MRVLGIAGRRRHAAAALAIDGAVVAAATEECCTRLPNVGYAAEGGLPAAAIDACLRRADVDASAIDEIAIVDDGSESEGGAAPDPAEMRPFRRAATRIVDPAEADAAESASACDADAGVLVFAEDPPMLVAYSRAGGQLRRGAAAFGIDRLLCAARTLARAVGAPAGDPVQALDRIAARGEPEFLGELAAAIRWRPRFGVEVDLERLAPLVRHVSPHDADEPAIGAPTLNVRLQEQRAALAASFIECAADVVQHAAEAGFGSVDRVCLGGSAFAAARLNTSMYRRLRDAAQVAPVPEASGRAIGAALGCRSGSALTNVALGPVFSEAEIKATLDNCRLDYVYEPDWRRLLERVSKMLSRGMVIGWFQGPMVFGPRSLGTRSILCDPSTRYARENVNEFLKRVPPDAPLPISLLETQADDCLATPLRSPFMLLDAGVKELWRDRVRAALDHRYEVRVHTVALDQAPELSDLLRLHFERSGVPGLINTNLSGPGEPTACSPRDAVRTVYSSATDALVIGRFLLMKDYWLLRSDAN